MWTKSNERTHRAVLISTCEVFASRMSLINHKNIRHVRRLYSGSNRVWGISASLQVWNQKILLKSLSSVDVWASDTERKSVEDSCVNSISANHHARLKRERWSKHTHARKPHTVQSFQCQTPLQPSALTCKTTAPHFKPRTSVSFPLFLRPSPFQPTGEERPSSISKGWKDYLYFHYKVLLIWQTPLNTVGCCKLLHWPSLYPSLSRVSRRDTLVKERWMVGILAWLVCWISEWIFLMYL